jgi:hypothetical protein
MTAKVAANTITDEVPAISGVEAAVPKPSQVIRKTVPEAADEHAAAADLNVRELLQDPTDTGNRGPIRLRRAAVSSRRLCRGEYEGS